MQRARTALGPVIAAVVVAACVLGAPAEGACTETALGFGATYVTAGGEQRTHHGVDVAAAPGASVAAIADGTVKFAGRVPAQDGGTVLVVSVECADGVFTAMPLAEASVGAGDSVSRGDSLGSLAASGDPSSSATHVHYGLKRGSLYLDPSSLLAAFALASEAEAETQPQPHAAEEAPTPAVQPAMAAPRVPSGSPVAAPAGAAAPRTASGAAAPRGATSSFAAPQPMSAGGAARVAAGAGASALANTTTRAGSGAVAPSGEIAPGVSMPAAAATSRSGIAGAASRSGMLAGGVSATAVGAGVARAALARIDASPRAVVAGVAAVSVALFSCILLFGLSALRRRIESNSPVSDRLGTMLQHLRAGDTICGLTSCSGHSAFTDPGPPAQRR